MIAWFDHSPPIVEDAILADAEALADIHATAFRHGWPAAEIEALIASANVRALVARTAGPMGRRQPIGFVIARIAADEAEVLTIAVDPRQRGKGVGRALMEEAMRRLYYERVRSVFLEVDEGNGPALALYRRLGYVKVGQRGNYYRADEGTGANALVMRADLT